MTCKTTERVYGIHFSLTSLPYACCNTAGASDERSKLTGYKFTRIIYRVPRPDFENIFAKSDVVLIKP